MGNGRCGERPVRETSVRGGAGAGMVSVWQPPVSGAGESGVLGEWARQEGSGQVTAGESDRPQANILSRRRAELTGGSLRGFLVRLDLFLPLGALSPTCPASR